MNEIEIIIETLLQLVDSQNDYTDALVARLSELTAN